MLRQGLSRNVCRIFLSCSRRFSGAYSPDTAQIEKELLHKDYLLPIAGHNVFVIQPDIKFHSGSRYSKNVLTTPELQLQEACALVDSLQGWKVKTTKILSLFRMDKGYLYGTGNRELLKREIHQSQASAVFISIGMLTGLQLSNLQQYWSIPVYDRYTLVLQIFKLRAKTREAKLQVALAEIPYYKSRMLGLHHGLHDVHQYGDMTHIGGSGETYLEKRRQLLEEREFAVRKTLEKMKEQRQLMKKERKRRNIPTVAIVGYTNAGKTSLIRALTGHLKITPMNKLFATLDVTVHAGLLPSTLKVLYVDTIGFIADIPTELVQCFSATLQDMIDADVIVHIQDASHPDRIQQRYHVIQTLSRLELQDKKSLEHVINVYNKCDLISQEQQEAILEEDSSAVLTSSTAELGLIELREAIECTIMTVTDYQRKTFKLPMNTQHLSWLYKNTTVVKAEPLQEDQNFLLVDVVLTVGQYNKFKALFGKTRQKKLNVHQ